MNRLFISMLLFIAGCSSGVNEIFVNDKEVAVNGYDVVGYFTEGKPVAGTEEFQYRWNGATWHFSSAVNRDLFEANPAAYAPQYGGYCAYGTADGHKASTEPDAWTIVGNKLYLNYNKEVQTIWLKDQAEFIRKADGNWPEVKTQSY